MDKVTDSQVNIYEQIEKILTNYKKAGKDRLTKGFVEARLEIADKYWQSFEQQHNTLLSAKIEFKEKSDYFQTNLFDDCFEKYLDLKTRMKERLNEIEESKRPSHISTEQDSKVVLDQFPLATTKLPPIQLPTFSGEYREWLSFRDLFKSLVHENVTLCKVNKCQYLKSSLRGEAESLVKQIQVSDATYDIIWNMLNKRYDNKRSIVNTYIGKLLNHKRVTSESAKNIRELLDVTYNRVSSYFKEPRIAYRQLG